MADISITGPVTPTGSLANVGMGIAAVAITAGQAVYEDAATSNQLRLADSNASASAQAVGIAVCSAAIGEVCVYAKNGTTITQAGTTFGKNIALFVSENAGFLAPNADVGSGEYGCCLGFGLSTTTFKVQITYTGVAT
jgi:hypothetical protein